MSINFASDLDRYTRPELPARTESKFRFDEINNLTSMSNMNVPANFDRSEYPTSGRHARFPILINCDGCNDLTMTDIEYKHGCASKVWCILLLPIFCTGFCCLCLNSCKDVKHICSRCRKEAGTCKSNCIWFITKTLIPFLLFKFHFYPIIQYFT